MSSEEDYLKDELVTPSWMDKAFLEMVLRQSEHEVLLKITDFKIKPASGKDDHFSSFIYRIQINYTNPKTNEEKTKSIILKTEPYAEGTRKDMLGSDFFDIEIRMYSETIPEIQKLLSSIGDKRDFAPRLLYHSLTPAKILIFDDLSVEGYTTPKEFRVNDLLAKLAIIRLGQMHAASIALNVKDEGSVSSYAKSIYDMNLGGEGLFLYTEHTKSLIEEMRTWSGYESYVERLENIVVNANLLGRKMFTANTPEEGYNVLNHGDFHGKNLMFKNIDSDDAEIMMIDFQICCYGTPAHDLIDALYMMVNSENKEEFIQYYYEAFSSTLRDLQFSGKIPSYGDLKNELHKNRFYEVFLTIFTTPFACADPNLLNLDDIFDFNGKAPALRKALYANPKFHLEFKRLLPEYLERGLLD